MCTKGKQKLAPVVHYVAEESAVSPDQLRGVSGWGQCFGKLKFMTILVCLIHL